MSTTQYLNEGPESCGPKESGWASSVGLFQVPAGWPGHSHCLGNFKVPLPVPRGFPALPCSNNHISASSSWPILPNWATLVLPHMPSHPTPNTCSMSQLTPGATWLGTGHSRFRVPSVDLCCSQISPWGFSSLPSLHRQ